MGQKDIGWEDIRKQPAYKAGQRARQFAQHRSTTAQAVRENIRHEYRKLNKVDRQVFRNGWCDR